MIDAHVHFWDPAANPYPWLASVPVLNRAFLPSDLDPNRWGIDGIIVVEAGCQDGRAELDWLDRCARQWPVVVGVVAHVPLEHSCDVATLAAVAEHRLTVGVRRNVQDEAPGFLLADAMVAGVRRLAGHGLPFDACIRSHQLAELTQLVQRCPEVTFVLDHLGKPDIRERRREPWFGDLAALARLPNVVAKLSGLTTEADHERWQPSDVAPYLTHAIDVFGPERCLFGSDWPVATLATTYQRWVDLIADTTSDLTGTERFAIQDGTSARIYTRRTGRPA
jgi:L-fuconolactonase